MKQTTPQPPRPKLVTGPMAMWVTRTIEDRFNDRFNYRETMHGLRRQRFLRLKNKPAQAFQQSVGEGIKIPFTFRLIETVIGSVAGGNRPTFNVTSPDPELSRRASHWCSLNLNTQERIGQQGLYWKFWDSLTADGIAFIKTQRWPWTDFPIRNDTESDSEYADRVAAYMHAMPRVPWRSRVVDAATCLPPLSEWGPGWMVETGLRPSWETYAALGLAPARNGNFRFLEPGEPPLSWEMQSASQRTKVRVDELWTEDDLFVRIGGRVWQYPNEMGRVPYQIVSGSTIPFADPTLQAMSVAFPLIYIEPWINNMYAQIAGNAQLATTPSAVTEHDLVAGNPQAAAKITITEYQPGMHYDMPPGSHLKFVQPPLDVGVIQFLQNMVQTAERFTMSPTPAFMGTRTPGTVLAAYMERVNAVLAPRRDMAQNGLAEWQKFCLHLLGNVIEAPAISMSGLVFEEARGRSRAAVTALKKTDVANISDVLCEIRFQTSMDKIAWDSHNVMMYKSGIWRRDRAMRESGVEDPEQERLDIALDTLLESPPIQMYMIQRALSGTPPEQSLQELYGEAGGKGSLGGFLGAGAGAETPTGGQPGRLTGEARQPGGTGNGPFATAGVR